jgi:CheY-specific phosphatase CheX/CheY-like chemotaxis protein
MKAKKILIADNTETCKALSAILHEQFEGIEIIPAIDGNEALNKCQAERFSVVMLNLELPHLRGPSVIKHLGRLKPKFMPEKIIFLAESNQEIPATVLKQSLILRKPIDAETLVQHLTEVLYAHITKRTEKFNVEIINPFLEGVLKTIEAMCSTIPVIMEKKIRPRDSEASADLSAMIPMRSTLFKGSMILGFPQETYLKFYKAMLDEEITEITDDNDDGASELCNQIFGHAKAELNKMGFDLEPSLPMVVHGPGHRIKHIIDSSSLVLNFNSSFGSFFVEITMKSNKV